MRKKSRKKKQRIKVKKNIRRKAKKNLNKPKKYRSGAMNIKGKKQESVGHGNLIKRTDQDGRVWEYNTDGRLIRMTSAYGVSFEMEYHRDGYPLKLSLSDGEDFFYDYPGDGNPPRLVSIDGKVIRTEQDAECNILKFIYEVSPNGDLKEGVSERLEFSADGKLIKEICSDGRVFEHDAAGNLIKATCPDGKVFEYDAAGNLVKASCPDGRAHEYDAAGNLIEVTGPDGRVREYNAAGNVFKQTYPDGRVYEYEYDANGNMVKATCSDGKVYEYDANGNVARVIFNGAVIEEWENNGERTSAEQGNQFEVTVKCFSCDWEVSDEISAFYMDLIEQKADELLESHSEDPPFCPECGSSTVMLAGPVQEQAPEPQEPHLLQLAN